MKNSNKERGITLIALVISIIVMIMLATVSLNMTIGENGIITRARESKLKQEEANVETEVMSGIASLDTEYYQKVSADTGITIDSIYSIAGLEKYVNGKINGFHYSKNGTSVVYFTNSNGSYTVKFDKDGNAKTYKGIYVEKYDSVQISMDNGDTIDLSTSDDSNDIIWIDITNGTQIDNNKFTKNSNGQVIIKGFKNKGKDNEELIATVIVKDDEIQGNETVDTSDESKIIAKKDVGANGSNVTAYVVQNDNGKYTLDIKGNGKIAVQLGAINISIPGEENNDNIEKIVIEEGITEIGSMNFAVNYKNVTELVLPESIEKIGGGAFSDMQSLETLKYNCKNATIEPTYYRAGSGVSIVPNFYNSKLKTIILGDNVQTVGERAFFGLTELEGITLGDKITEIGKQAFYGCVNLKNIYFGTNITSIGENAFNSCHSLESITIPEQVKKIGSSAFFNCTKLKNFTYKAIDCEYIGIVNGSISGIAMNCPIENLIIGEKVQQIPNGIFAALTDLKKVDIPDSVNYIYSGAFYDCSNLVDIKIGNNVMAINSQAFQATAIKEITIPEKVIILGYGVFKDCKNLETVNYNAIMAAPYVVSGNKIIPEFNEDIKTVNIGEKVKYIGEYLFAYYENLTEINISDSVVEIDFAAFYQDKNITKVNLGKNLKTIGEKAFYNIGITEITIPENVTKISANAFLCNNLKTVYYNAINATANCLANNKIYPIFSSAVDSIIIGQKVEYLDDCIFSATSIATVTIPKSVTTINTNIGPFAFCNSLTEIRINKPKDSIAGAPWAYNKTDINVIWDE